MEYFLFPKKSYYLTQGYGKGSFSHQNRIALDVSASGGGSKEIYAPFTGYVAKIYVDKRFAYSCWLVSSEKVICADGVLRYAIAMFTHPSEIASLRVGQTFKQGDHLMNDGDTGHATGKHLDLQIAVYDNKGDIKVDWHKVNGDWSLIGDVNPCDYMVMANDCKVLKETYLNKAYHFKKQSEVVAKEETTEYTKGIYETLANVYVRTGAGTNFAPKKVKDMSADGKKHATSTNLNDDALYKKGTQFDALEIIKVSDNEYWAKGYSGYINIEKNGIIACKKVK